MNIIGISLMVIGLLLMVGSSLLWLLGLFKSERVIRFYQKLMSRLV